MIPIIMPQVGQDIRTAEIVRWLKQENDPVEKGEVILIVESEKASFEIEAEESGVLLKVFYQEGQQVEILTPVGYIGQPGEQFDAQQKAATAESKSALATKQAQTASRWHVLTAPQRLVASPSARRLARQKSLELAGVVGSGPGGRIIKRDVLAAMQEPEKVSDTVEPFGRMRKHLAQRLTLSQQTIPHYYLSVDVDMTGALEWRRSYNAQHDTRVTVTDLVVKAAAGALERFPRLNAHVLDDRVVIKKRINIGVAVSVKGGLLVPVIAEADKKSLKQISELAKKKIEDARRGVITLGPARTFTISSLGMYGVKQFLPIINPPECAILAVASAQQRVVPVAGEIGVRQMMTLTLACDHRAVDGADAAGLLNEIKSYLEEISDIQEQWT